MKEKKGTIMSPFNLIMTNASRGELHAGFEKNGLAQAGKASGLACLRCETGIGQQTQGHRRDGWARGAENPVVCLDWVNV